MSRRRGIPMLVGVAVAVAATACTGQSSDAHSAPATAGPTARPAGCTAAVTNGSLPIWARAGFTPSTQSVLHMSGAVGDIVGVLFGQPLRVPASPGRANKILWISRVPVPVGSTLAIHATLENTGLTVDRQVAGGPGPSVIDVPRPGCWSFDLAWSGHVDRLSVPYEAG